MYRPASWPQAQTGAAYTAAPMSRAAAAATLSASASPSVMTIRMRSCPTAAYPTRTARATPPGLRVVPAAIRRAGGACPDTLYPMCSKTASAMAPPSEADLASERRNLCGP